MKKYNWCNFNIPPLAESIYFKIYPTKKYDGLFLFNNNPLEFTSIPNLVKIKEGMWFKKTDNFCLFLK